MSLRQSDTPFSTLTPDRLLDALESVGLRPDGRLLALNSYENRVYQVALDDGGVCIAKFYRFGRWSDAAIREEHDFTCELAERELPVVAPKVLNGKTLHAYEDLRFAVFPRQRGRAAELDSPDVRQWMGRFIGRIHAVGRLKRFQHRPALSVETFGQDSRDFIAGCGALPDELAEIYLGVVDQALELARQCFARAGNVATLRLHGDCHGGNVLWNDGPFFVDFDDARTGPAIQDLWMLLSGGANEQQRQLTEVLEGYQEFCDFDRSELHLIEALRTLRLIHYAAWLARRWDDPAFPAAFPWFGSVRYWQDRILELREQIGQMQEAPISLPF